MNFYKFYYDESGHSRKLNEKTITADNFDDYFVSVIIGIDKNQSKSLNEKYLLFEEKYKTYYKIEELKSTLFSDKKYKYGFKTFKQKDLELIESFFDLIIEHNLIIYISIQNKIEYLVNQLFRDYKNSVFIDADAMKYTITKAVTVYRPIKVLSSIYKGDTFANELKSFLEERIAINGDLKLKERENDAFKQACLLINKSKELSFDNWSYTLPFCGFSLFLKEQNITSSEIIIDKEGSGETLNAAKKCGFMNSYEKDSKGEVGIRIADMLAGIINSFLKSIIASISYIGAKQPLKKLIDNKWFELNDLQFDCYKKMQKIIIEQNSSWHKTYCTHYSDAFVFLISLLNYIKQNGVKGLLKNGNKNNEFVNTCACLDLENHFKRLSSKLKVEPVVIKDDHFLNQRGAKEYLSKDKRMVFSLQEGESKRLFVLNVGIFLLTNTPTMTIRTGGRATAYDLPQELYGWVMSLVSLANCGTNLLPGYVDFTKKNNKYYAYIE